MFRDRLMELCAIQAHYNGHEEEEDEEEAEAEELLNLLHFHMDMDMKAFFALVEEILDMLKKMEENIAEVKRLHSNILSTILRNSNAKEHLNFLMGDIQRSVNNINEKIRLIELAIDRDEKQQKTSALLRMRKMQYATLSYKFVELMADYNRIQIEYGECCKARIQRQLEITGRSISREQLENMLEQGNPLIFTQGIITDSQQTKQTIADIEERHADIMKLETSIGNLHGMFSEMTMLLHSQGDMIDCIEYNVKHAKDFVQLAIEETKRAKKYRKKSPRKKLSLLIGLILLLILLFGLYII